MIRFRFITLLCFIMIEVSVFADGIKPSSPNPFGNALIPDMIADASIQQFDGTFYCYATTDGYGKHLSTSGPPVLWKSEDFVNWQFCGNYFPSAVGQLYWAPSKVIPYNGKYYIYPTINHRIYPAVSDSPEGPFKLAKGEDRFDQPNTSSTLFESDKIQGIDAEVFIDDDGSRYVFWNKRKVAMLDESMTRLASEPIELPSPHKVYSEGPIFFKRGGIYYYLYTLGRDENYQYAYMYSKVSPMGPYIIPDEDIIATTDTASCVFGPGHGTVFCVDGTDDWYFAFLEFSRRSTNRQTYVCKMEFNPDGTIRPIHVLMQGVGKLRKSPPKRMLTVKSVSASSVKSSLWIKPNLDNRLNRIEYFNPQFVADGSNGSRWMADESDKSPWFTIDLGKRKYVEKSNIFFVRPTESHSYQLEVSEDGKNWKTICRYTDKLPQSPMTDYVGCNCRYLRVHIMEGVAGIWEWAIEGKSFKVYKP